jgi:hypothetical protein
MWAGPPVCCPEGTNDRSQAIYCLERGPKGNPSRTRVVRFSAKQRAKNLEDEDDDENEDGRYAVDRDTSIGSGHFEPY